jgi:hypothetical protein
MHVVVEIVKARAEYVPAGNDVIYGDAGGKCLYQGRMFFTFVSLLL